MLWVHYSSISMARGLQLFLDVSFSWMVHYQPQLVAGLKPKITVQFTRDLSFQQSLTITVWSKQILKMMNSANSAFLFSH